MQPFKKMIYMLRNDGAESQPQSVTVTNTYGYMQPCQGGTVDDHMGAGIMLDSAVSVDTLFFIDVQYAQDGVSCGINNLTQSLQVEVLSGQAQGEIDACQGGVYFSNGAMICSASVTGHNNTVDTIIY